MPDLLTTPLDPSAQSAARGTLRNAASLGPAPPGAIEAAAATACGSLHPENEDAHSALPGLGRLYVVADGVGGGAMAALASRQLVDHLHAALDRQRIDPARVRGAILQADRAIAQRIGELTAAPGAATVALCAPLNATGSRWLIAWVGDCRIYRLHDNAHHGAELLTRDDTYRHRNEVPPSGGSLDDPARMVGNGATGDPNVQVHEMADGALLALCSDGVHRHADARAWERATCAATPLAQRCARLVADAGANGCADDATVLMLQCAAAGAPNARCAS
ncbi:MAG: protein phosphatase 2C domain-containing protein [Rubrivivax sp.]